MTDWSCLQLTRKLHGIPDNDGVVNAARCQPGAVWGPGHVQDVPRVSPQGHYAAPRLIVDELPTASKNSRHCAASKLADNKTKHRPLCFSSKWQRGNHQDNAIVRICRLGVSPHVEIHCWWLLTLSDDAFWESALTIAGRKILGGLDLERRFNLIWSFFMAFLSFYNSNGFILGVWTRNPLNKPTGRG